MLEEHYSDIELGRRLEVPARRATVVSRVKAAWPWAVLAVSAGCLAAAGVLRASSTKRNVTRYVPVEVERIVEKKVIEKAEPVETVRVVEVRDEALAKRYEKLAEEHARLERAYEHLSAHVAEFERRAIVAEASPRDESLILCE
ncbi:MAG: hypothetical protein DWQ37_03905 [Planctomycetota bacterium]|nr:MAG: hypothetical protein DWQ37_03905 [Planctomycetota bacterium]